jgi:anti-sigma-K factor RskA
MNYDRPDLLDRLAAEYVLGTLPSRARRRFDRLRAMLPSADAAARAWETRTAPLAQPVPQAMPSPQLWLAIERRTGGAADERAALAGAKTSGGWFDFWKPALGFAFGVVAALGLVRLYPDTVVPIDRIVQERGTFPPSYVGLLTDRSGAPVVLANSTRHGRTLSLKILKPIDVPPGKVLQLWALPNGAAPFPVGVVPATGKGTIALADTSEKLFANVPRLGVSIEDKQATAGATPGEFFLSGHCVKLW